jgi:hypothetical protein
MQNDEDDMAAGGNVRGKHDGELAEDCQHVAGSDATWGSGKRPEPQPQGDTTLQTPPEPEVSPIRAGEQTAHDDASPAAVRPSMAGKGGPSAGSSGSSGDPAPTVVAGRPGSGRRSRGAALVGTPAGEAIDKQLERLLVDYLASD